MRCHTRHLWLPPLRPSFLELRRIVWENILTAGGKKKITFSQSLQTGKYLWVCLICFAFFGKSKRQFSLQRKRPFVFANASHPFLPSKKLFSQEKTAQAEIKGKHYLWKISLFEDKNHFTQCKCHLADFTGRKVMGGRLAMTHTDMSVARK